MAISENEMSLMRLALKRAIGFKDQNIYCRERFYRVMAKMVHEKLFAEEYNQDARMKFYKLTMAGEIIAGMDIFREKIFNYVNKG